MNIQITHSKVPQPVTNYCDCSRPATHRFAGWECDSCLAKRKAIENWNQEALEAKIHALQHEGLGQTTIAKRLGVDRNQVHRIVSRQAVERAL